MFPTRHSLALAALLTLVPATYTAVAQDPRDWSLQDGSTIPIRLNTPIDTATAKSGDTFQGVVAANVYTGGQVAIPIGSPVTGRVVEAKSAGRLSGAALLTLELVSVEVHGERTAISTLPLSSKNNGRGTSTAARTGGGAAVGAIIGGIAGGGAGAGIGAASGGALGVGSNILRPGQQIVLKTEALLQFKNAGTIGVGHGGGIASKEDHGYRPTPANSIPGQPDPYTFDIVGLKLGMTAQEASAAITARVPAISKSTFQPGTPQFTSTAHFTSGFSARASNFNVMLVFTESYPFDPQKPERLNSIFYTAITPTQADRDRFEQAALAKYGPPVAYQKGIGGRWCNVGTAAAPGNYVCSPDAPNLVLRGGNELILGDNGIAARERVEWNKQTTGTPPI